MFGKSYATHDQLIRKLFHLSIMKPHFKESVLHFAPLYFLCPPLEATFRTYRHQKWTFEWSSSEFLARKYRIHWTTATTDQLLDMIGFHTLYWTKHTDTNHPCFQISSQHPLQ